MKWGDLRSGWWIGGWTRAISDLFTLRALHLALLVQPEALVLQSEDLATQRALLRRQQAQKPILLRSRALRLKANLVERFLVLSGRAYEARAWVGR